MTNNGQRGKYWVWTLNNPTDEELAAISALCSGEDVAYLCFGKEVGESGTPHLQGYLELSKKLRLGGVKRLNGMGRAHLELRRGTQSEAIAYTQKDEDWHEYGEATVSRQGSRSDLLKIKDLLDTGSSEATIANEYFGSWVRYRKSFQAYADLKTENRLRDISVYCIWGPPGTGKTRLIYANEPSLFIQSDTKLQWFDGYRGEEAVLLDDYRGDGTDAFILRLLDRYPLRVPVKGGFVNWTPLRIYITSNMPPPFGHMAIEQALLRRIKNTYHMHENQDFSDDLTVGLLFMSIIQ